MHDVGRRRTFPLAVLLALVAGATPVQAQGGPVHVEIREFFIGGQTMAGPAPGPPPEIADPGRCDVECEVSAVGLSKIKVDVQGPEGPFQYQYERKGCWWFSTPANRAEEMPAGEAEGPRWGMGEKTLDVAGCTSLLVRPATVHMVTDPWQCTREPEVFEVWYIPIPSINKPWWPREVPVPVPLPVALEGQPPNVRPEPRLGPYEAFADCIQSHCLVVSTQPPCLPNYSTQATGTVRIEW